MDKLKYCLAIKKKLVGFLDKTGELSKIEFAAKKYEEDSKLLNCEKTDLPPLKISLLLDFVLLAEILGEFSNLLVEEPFVAKELLLQLVHASCLALTKMQEVKVYLLVRLSSFPDSIAKSHVTCNMGLVSRHGILSELSIIEKYTIDTSYMCNQLNCYQQEKILKESGKCTDCGKKVAEVARLRLSGERVFGLFLDPSFLTPHHNYNRTQGTRIEFRDELCAGLEVGARYNIIMTVEENKYVAWGIQLKLPEPLVRAITGVQIPTFPTSISQLLFSVKKETHGSPWASVTALACLLVGDAYPCSTFLHLKTALLLSLVSICTKSPVPILALGDCGNLMTLAWRCCPRGLQSPNGPTNLLLASHGVCLLHENTILSYVTTAVESELVTVEMEKDSKEKRLTTFPLRSAVWLYWQCNKHSGQDVKKLRTLIDIIGMPFLEEIDVDDETLSSHILQKAMKMDSSSNTLISEKDYRKFIDTICGLQVEMSSLASQLIREYFVASRRERPECLPLKAIKILTGLSESHARLSLRDTVTYEDAVAAIFLYEESISILFGPSLFSELPKRNTSEESPIAIAQQMDNILGRFSLWLTSYTKSLNNNNSFQRDD